MDAERVRRDFPVLQREWPNGRLIYFDNACSSLKPTPVIDAVTAYYRDTPVCGERSLHRLGTEVTLKVDAARSAVAELLHARSPAEVVFTKNATEGLNLVAHAFLWKKGDVVVTTDKEHNSNWVPWLELARRGIIRHLRVPSLPDGGFDLSAYERTLQEAGERLRLVSVPHVSNADGTVVPGREVATLAHERGALVLLDAAQSVPHRPVDVQALGVDFLVASLPKMMGPSGLGFLYGRLEALERLGPFLLGGNTVRRSGEDGYEWNELPHRFEAGLQNYAALAAVPAAVSYLQGIGLDAIREHETRLNQRLSRGLQDLPGVRVHGPDPAHRSGIVPFTVEGVDVNDVAVFVDERRNIAIRSGAFCVHPFFERRGLNGWCRASLYAYNTEAEVDEVVRCLEELARGVRAPRARAA